MDQMIPSQNCLICRKISGKHPFLQSCKHLTLQLCLAGNVANTHVIISALTPKETDDWNWVGYVSLFLHLWIPIFFTALPLCLSLNVPSFCFLVQTKLYIEELNWWSLGEINEWGFFKVPFSRNLLENVIDFPASQRGCFLNWT